MNAESGTVLFSIKTLWENEYQGCLSFQNDTLPNLEADYHTVY